MFFEKNSEEIKEDYSFEKEQYEYNKKYGFLNELKSAVKTDEEYARYKGYIN